MRHLTLVVVMAACASPGGGVDAGAQLDAIDLTSLGHFEGHTSPGEAAYDGGASCVLGGAPTRLFRVDVPAHRRVLLKAQAEFVARLYLVSADGAVDCNRTGANDGSRAQLAWYNASDATQPLRFLLGWNGGLPNPSSIPSVGTFQVDVAFDSGAPAGESCLAPAALSLSAPTTVSVSDGQNDEGPGGQVDHVFTASVPAGKQLTLSLESPPTTGTTADVYVYTQGQTCGGADFAERVVVGYSSAAVQRTYSSSSAAALTLTLVVEPNATFDLGAIVITPTVTP